MSRARFKICVFLLAALMPVVFVGCDNDNMSEKEQKGTITKEPFGTTKSGEAVDIYTLKNAKGSIAKIMTYGGTVVQLMVPDKNGKMGDIVLGFDNLKDYEEKS